MKKLNFYRQQRVDGGVRTGIEIGETTVMEQFERGRGAENSALVWFVDIRCSGRNLPEDPEAARAWFLDQGVLIQGELKKLALELSAGIDFEPISHEVLKAPRNVGIKIVCTAIRRIEAREMARVLVDIASRWQNLIESLPFLELASR